MVLEELSLRRKVAALGEANSRAVAELRYARVDGLATKLTFRVEGEIDRAKVRTQPRKKLPPGSRLSEWKLLTTTVPIESSAPRIGNTRHATHV